MDFYKRFVKPGVSLADLIFLGGLLAVKECGGPNIPFHAGRADVANPNPTGMLPDTIEPFNGLLDKFRRMGLSLREMIILSIGGHTVGFAPSEMVQQREKVAFDQTPDRFDTQVFQQLMAKRFTLVMDDTFMNNGESQGVIDFFAKSNLGEFHRAFSDAYVKMGRNGADLTLVDLGFRR
jgi:hypothetical protein